MIFVTLDDLRLHCRADGDDDAVLTKYGNAAEATAQMRANRKFYVDGTARTAALNGMPAAVSAAWATYDAAIAAADAMSDERAACFARESATSALNETLNAQDAIMHGIIITDDLKQAIYLIAADWYRNREETITGPGAQAVQIPTGAEAIIARYHWEAL